MSLEKQNLIHRLAATVILALVQAVRGRVPLRNALARRVEDKLRCAAIGHRPHSLVERVVYIARRPAAIHRRDVALRVVGVAVVAVVGHVARCVVGEGSGPPST